MDRGVDYGAAGRSPAHIGGVFGVVGSDLSVGGKSKSFGASLGISAGAGLNRDAASGQSSFGLKAPTITAGVNGAKGSYAGEDITHRETVLSAGGTITITTPDRLTIAGAQAVGETVNVDAGSLAIESRQDCSTYCQS